MYCYLQAITSTVSIKIIVIIIIIIIIIIKTIFTEDITKLTLS